MRALRSGFRMLLKSPGFTAIALITMALGIGANTAIFTIANAVLLRPLPYSDPTRLLLVSAAQTSDHSKPGPYSFPRFEFIREHARSYTGVAAFTSEGFTLVDSSGAEQLSSARVSANFFNVLGIHPAIGRDFIADEDRPGGQAVVIISHSLWVRHFGADPRIGGRTIQLDGRDCTIVGVLPADFQFLPLGTTIDAWVPRVFELNVLVPGQLQAGASFLSAIARLRPGVTRDQAQAEMAVIDRAYQREKPGLVDADPRSAVITFDLQEQLVSNVKAALMVLLGAVGFVLLIACANVAGLLLSRAMERKKEIAIRVALGASRSDIVRQLLAESLVLALVSGCAGIILSQWGVKGLVALASGSVPQVLGVHSDARVLGFAFAVSVFSGILFGLVPALQISKGNVEAVLRSEGNRSTGTRERHLARNVLIVCQVALSVVLLAGSGLLIRSFIRLRTSSAGFDSRNLLTMNVNLSPARFGGPAKQVDFYRLALERTGAVPGVTGVAITSALPVNPSRFSPMLFEGQAQLALAQRPVVNLQMVSPDYAAVFGIPVTHGRAFAARDDQHAPPVALVNETVARRYWPNQNPVGKKIWLGRMVVPTEVVGVLGDVKNLSLAADPNPEVFVPFAQRPWAFMNITVRAKSNPANLAGALRRALAEVDREQPVTGVQTLDEILDTASGQPRLMMMLVAIFSLCALVMAIVGLYGVITRSVAQRTREFGVRVALGADTRAIVLMVLRESGVLAGIGTAIGIGGALAVTRIMESQLYKVSATDPLSFAASALIFGGVALVASYVPARRAARLNPVEALRSE